VLGVGEPLVAGVVELIALVEEVRPDDVLEVLRRAAEVADHGMLDGGDANGLVVQAGVLVAAGGVDLRLVAGLVEEGLGDKDQ